MKKKMFSLYLLCLFPIVLLAGSGDTNGDGKVNVADIVEIVKYLQGTPSANFNATEADISGNGKVNETDIKILKEIIMSGNEDKESIIEFYTLQELILDAQEKIDQLNDKINQTEPKLLQMEFLASENQMQLVENVECEIIGDSTVKCRVLNVMSAKTLIPRFRFTGEYVTIGGQKAVSGETAFDFSSEQKLVVHAGEQTKEYIVMVSAYTGLPTLWAETQAHKFKEANHYYEATISLSANIGDNGKGGITETKGKIMAEGSLRSYTKYDWSDDPDWGKNDYRLNFDNAISLLDMPSHTDWELMPNVNDVTMLHNQTALYMSTISNLEYTPRFQYVDLIFNDHYSGTYMLGEHLSAASSRINVGNDGFILSISSAKAGSTFTTSHLEQPVSILSPSSPKDADVKYIKDLVRNAEYALFSSDFTNESTGWQKYMDINSFVDWYLINEIAKNTKGAFQSDCIMSCKRGGKLKMGPVWNFETAFGDTGRTDASGFAIKGVSWYKRLFEDPVFVAHVKDRFDFFFNHQAEIIREINENAQYLKYAIQEDNTKWGTFGSYKSSDADTWVLYQGHVSSMKSWLSERMNWLKEQFDAMPAARHVERARWDAEQALRNAEQGAMSYSMSQSKSSVSQTQRNGQLRLMWEALQYRLDSLEKVLDERMEPKLLSMEFVTNDNSSLQENIKCKIVGDSIIECWLPGVTNDKILKPRFTFEGTMMIIDGYEAESGKTAIDFTSPRTVTVATSSKNKYYKIYVHSFTGLPMMYITTDGLQEVTSKEEYIGANLVLREDVRTRAAGSVIESRVNIKGRGNSSWKFPKKPFRLKFDEKISLLDMHKDKSWVLIPNFNDKSMLRNSLAFYMSNISNLDYTPESHFVELTFNGKYWGTYLLCEKVKISNHRVAVGDTGLLFEVDFWATSEADSRYFSVSNLESVVNIKDPDVEYSDENFRYAKDFLTKADAALFGSNFTDPVKGWQAYLDMDSFVDWYLIQEIGKNIDGNFFSSCYMHLTRGGKLKMGPMWDMDVAFGNIDQANQTCYDPEGFYVKDAKWYARLFKDPAFVARVKERFDYFYCHQNDILANVNADAQYLKYSAQENNDVWHVLNVKTWPNYNMWGSYQNEVQDVKEWLVARMGWLKAQFNKM